MLGSFNSFTTWNYFLINYEKFTIPYTGSHGLLILNEINCRIFSQEYYKTKYPEIGNHLQTCREIADKYKKEQRFTSVADIRFLEITTEEIYNVAPPLFKYAVKANKTWIEKKRELGFNHDEQKGDKTFLISFMEKVFS